MLRRWVTVAGWVDWSIAVVALGLGVSLSWREFLIVGGVALLAGLVGLAWLRGRVAATLSFRQRITRSEPGATATVILSVQASAGSGIRSVDIDIPMGVETWTRRVGRLRPLQTVDLPLTVDTPRRMVIPLGPVNVVRRDPLGLYERLIRLPVTASVVVHPAIVTLPPLSAGFVRDLEGETSRDLTDADLSFHALREYVPGDDRRHIHWRSSAKTGRMMVRQYEQTRRSRMMIVCDTRADSYLDDDEFELAVSVAASLGVRALRDSRDVGFIVARSGQTHASNRSRLATLNPVDAVTTLSSASPARFLDDVAGLTRSGEGMRLGEVSRHAVAEAVDVSIVFLVTGSSPGIPDLQQASLAFGRGVEVVALRCAREVTPSLRSTGRLTVGAVGRLDDLTRLMSRERVGS